VLMISGTGGEDSFTFFNNIQKGFAEQLCFYDTYSM
jgi:hypothetical protein